MGFLEKFRRFMIGRYGFDTLSGFLLVLSVLLWLVNVFVWNHIASMVLLAIEMGLVALVVFRALSRNINMRALENRRFKRCMTLCRNGSGCKSKSSKNARNTNISNVRPARRSCASATKRASTASAVPSAATISG